MKRITLFIILVLCFSLQPYAQNNRHRSRARTHQTNQRSRAKQNSRKQTYRYNTTKEIRNLQSQQQAIQKEIRQHETELHQKESDVKQRLDNLIRLSADINQHQKTIDTIASDVKHLDGNIGMLKGQLTSLESQLGERRQRFIRSMRYMARHRSVQDKLMFIFSAKNLTQMYRRLRFVREYAAYQRAQGELLQAKQRQVDGKRTELSNVRTSKSRLLYKSKDEHRQMENKKVQQQGVVASLQKDQAVLQNVIADRRKKQSALNAQIDRLVNIEIQKARARAAAEARAQRAARAVAAKRRAAALAAKRAAAERQARENARRIALARQREAKAKAAAEAAARAAEEARRKAAAEAAAAKEAAARERAQKAAAQAAARKAAAEQEAREAQAARQAAERKAAIDNQRAEAAKRAEAKARANANSNLSSADRAMTGSFANNRGRLPRPLNGRIVSHYGSYNVSGLSNVRLSNAGINIKGSAGAPVRSVFRGEVSAVFSFAGTKVVMVRHGAYISVYCNLGSVSVHKGQNVGTGQTLGTVDSKGILQFQLRKETQKLNPEQWLR